MTMLDAAFTHVAPAVTEVARAMTFGARKYGARNWERGLPWSSLVGATMRHLSSRACGELRDAESGALHTASAGFSLLALRAMQGLPEWDDLGGSIREGLPGGTKGGVTGVPPVSRAAKVRLDLLPWPVINDVLAHGYRLGRLVGTEGGIQLPALTPWEVIQDLDAWQRPGRTYLSASHLADLILATFGLILDDFALERESE